MKHLKQISALKKALKNLEKCNLKFDFMELRKDVSITRYLHQHKVCALSVQTPITCLFYHVQI